jgi:hypothetical protein
MRDRNDWFFVVGRCCFKAEATACADARCRQEEIRDDRRWPATVACAK